MAFLRDTGRGPSDAPEIVRRKRPGLQPPSMASGGFQRPQVMSPKPPAPVQPAPVSTATPGSAVTPQIQPAQPPAQPFNPANIQIPESKGGNPYFNQGSVNLPYGGGGTVNFGKPPPQIQPSQPAIPQPTPQPSPTPADHSGMMQELQGLQGQGVKGSWNETLDILRKHGMLGQGYSFGRDKTAINALRGAAGLETGSPWNPQSAQAGTGPEGVDIASLISQLTGGTGAGTVRDPSGAYVAAGGPDDPGMGGPSLPGGGALPPGAGGPTFNQPPPGGPTPGGLGGGLSTSPASQQPLGSTAPPPSSIEGFTSDENLRASQINPATLTGQTNALDQAFRATGQQAEMSPELQAARSQALEQMGSLGGPDRTQLALDAFKQFQEAGEPAFQQRLTDVGRKAAALGRIGSGVTTTELGDVQLQREKDLSRRGQELSTQAAGQTLQDRLQALQGSLGAAGTFGAQDIAGGQLGLGRAGMLGQLAGQQFGQGLTGREEMRGERGYQDQMAQSAMDRRVQQALLQSQLGGQQFNQQLQQLQLAGQLGLGGNPFGYLQASNQVPQNDPYGTFQGLGAQAGWGQQPTSTPSFNPGTMNLPGNVWEGQSLGGLGSQPGMSLFGGRPRLGG